MDNELYKDSFEQLLKEQADRFTMQPTKKVWHSIYNDLHPARKWPSIAISLLLIISLLLLGYLNTNNSRRQSLAISLVDNQEGNALGEQSNPSSQPVAANGGLSGDNTTPTNTDASSKTGAATMVGANGPSAPFASHPTMVAPVVKMNTRTPRRTSRQSSVQAIQSSRQQNATPATQPDPNNTNNLPLYQPTTGNDNKGDNDNTPVSNDKNITNAVAPAQTKTTIGNAEGVVIPMTSATAQAANAARQVEDADNSAQDNNTKTDIAAPTAEQNTGLQKPAVINSADKAWMEDYALYNKPRRNKLKDRLSWQVYLTPSVSYRTLFENTISEGRTNLQSLVTNPFARQAGIENSVEHKPGPSLELGGALVYQLAKKWQLKFGAQVNYTSYYATANNIKHPIATSLAVNNFFSSSLDLQRHSASISNTPGSNNDKLNNYTVQLALPVGFAYKFAGKDDLKFYLGATLQPSFVLAGSSPLLSGDRLFYVDNELKQSEGSFMRRFNIAMGIESFATFRMGEYTFLAGPQLRYQLLTTNNDKYTIGEKMYSLGVKMGITKRF